MSSSNADNHRDDRLESTDAGSEPERIDEERTHADRPDSNPTEPARAESGPTESGSTEFDRTEAMPADRTAVMPVSEASTPGWGREPQEGSEEPTPGAGIGGAYPPSTEAGGRTSAEPAAYGTGEEPAAPLQRPTGPHAPAIVLGLVCVAIAALVLAQELGTLSVDWGNVGPLGIVTAGAVLVVLGLVGLLSSRRSD